MESPELEVLNKYGFHVRPSTAFVKLAQSFVSTVSVCVINGSTVDGKNIMMLMTLCAIKGTRIKLICSGPDEQEAVLALTALVNSSFNGMD